MLTKLWILTIYMIGSIVVGDICPLYNADRCECENVCPLRDLVIKSINCRLDRQSVPMIDSDQSGYQITKYLSLNTFGGEMRNDTLKIFRSIDTIELIDARDVVWNSAMFKGVVVQRLLIEKFFADFPPKAFEDSTDLKDLRISSTNLINSLASGAFENLPTALETLWMFDASLQTVPKEILISLPSLQQLNLANNNIKTLRNGDLPLDKLQVLNLNDNPISVVEVGAFGQLRNLRVLKMIGNRLKSIDLSMLQNMHGLLTATFGNSPTIAEILASDLDIVPRNLETLIMSHCDLVRFDGSIERYIRNVNSKLMLDISNNRIECDENIDWMSDHLYCDNKLKIELAMCSIGSRSLEEYLRGVFQRNPCGISTTETPVETTSVATQSSSSSATTVTVTGETTPEYTGSSTTSAESSTTTAVESSTAVSESSTVSIQSSTTSAGSPITGSESSTEYTQPSTDYSTDETTVHSHVTESSMENIIGTGAGIRSSSVWIVCLTTLTIAVSKLLFRN